MGAATGSEAARRLAASGRADIEPGLSSAELDDVQREWDFAFADDHRAFLAAGLPVGRGWPDWRDGDRRTLRAMLDWPREGVLFDVESNAYWHPSWGARPADPDEALEIARTRLAEAPRLIPIYSHRYLPSGSEMTGHPVLSIHQTDVIHYGVDLIDYVHREFGGASPERHRVPKATVPFWKDLL